MSCARRRGAELKPGEVVRTWFGTLTILEIRPYLGPFDFVSGIACFGSAAMSIIRDHPYEVLLPDL